LLWGGAKAAPDGYTLIVGSNSHPSGEWFTTASSTKIRFVTYTITNVYGDLVAGQVDLIWDAQPAAIGNVRAGGRA
jgi:hypothetical protein